MESFPNGFTEAPFVWNISGDKHDMKFMSGFMGYEQLTDEEYLRPLVGWAIGKKEKAPPYQPPENENEDEEEEK